MNSLLDIGDICGSSRDLRFGLRDPRAKESQDHQMVTEELTVRLVELCAVFYFRENGHIEIKPYLRG
jgi:hypothetical protein